MEIKLNITHKVDLSDDDILRIIDQRVNPYKREFKLDEDDNLWMYDRVHVYDYDWVKVNKSHYRNVYENLKKVKELNALLSELM